MDSRATRSPSIRFLSIAVMAFVALLALGTMGALAASSTLLVQSLETVSRDSRSAVIASEIELDVLLYHRVSRLYAEEQEPELGELRLEIAQRIHGRLGEARLYSGGEEESALIEEVSRLVVRYFAERARSEGTGLGAEGVAAATRELLDAMIARLEAWRALNDAEVARARSEAATMDRIANVVAVCAAVLLFAGLAVVAFGVRGRILRPLLAIHHAITAFRRGEYEVTAPEGGPRELVNVARAFNEMRDALEERRREQLALVAGVAHDLRNPITALRMSASMLDEDASKEERAQVRAIMTRQLGQLAKMVDDLLDAYRVEAAGLQLDLEDTDLREVAQHVVELYTQGAPDHEIRLALPSDPVWVRGDARRLEQAIGNLVNNAIKYSPRGGRIDVSVAAEGEQAVVSVADRGIGIAPEDVQAIFAPFQRRAQETAPGAGLGLSVVRRIVNAHRGRVEVESRVGEGSRFRIRLPAIEKPRMRASA